jgi:hypothetical protein
MHGCEDRYEDVFLEDLWSFLPGMKAFNDPFRLGGKPERALRSSSAGKELVSLVKCVFMEAYAYGNGKPPHLSPEEMQPCTH